MSEIVDFRAARAARAGLEYPGPEALIEAAVLLERWADGVTRASMEASGAIDVAAHQACVIAGFARRMACEVYDDSGAS